MALLGENGTGRWPPWSRMQSLNEMTEEAGIDFDQFIESIKIRPALHRCLNSFKSAKTIESLQDHFFHYGIGSVQEAIKPPFVDLPGKP